MPGFFRGFLSILLLVCTVTNGCSGDLPVQVHVIGETDLAGDQAWKKQVRDAALPLLLRGTELPALEDALNDFSEGRGRPRNIRVEAGCFPYPERSFRGITLPAGRYPALRIVIGQGCGHNWWCALFPQLWRPESDEITYYSVLVDWILSLFGD